MATIATDGSKPRTDVYSPRQARSKRTQAPSDTALAQEMTRALIGYLGLEEEQQE